MLLLLILHTSLTALLITYTYVTLVAIPINIFHGCLLHLL